jgi:hypothetical protein
MRNRNRLVAFLSLLVLASSSRAPAASVGTAFTYQGRLTNAGAPVNGSCTFNFKLFDALTNGAQLGPTNSPVISVVSGLFTARLDFSYNLGGDARWLEVTVNCGSGAQLLVPRQPLTAAPYAVGLVPGAEVVGDSTAPALSGYIFVVEDTAVSGGYGAIYGGSQSPGTPAINGFGFSTGPGVYGENSAAGGGPGVKGYSSTGSGVSGTSGGIGAAVSGTGAGTGTGVLGVSMTGGGDGVHGETSGTTKSGVAGINTGVGYGLFGSTGGAGHGVHGSNASASGFAGYFDGRVTVTQDAYVGGLHVGPLGTAFKKVLAGTVTVGSSGTNATTYTVTFPSSFSGTPKVVATARNDPGADVADTFVVSTRSISASQVIFNILRVDSATGWGQPLLLDWEAWE